MNKQEFYRLRSKFRLLKRVYDDDWEIEELIGKLSKKPLDAQSVQLIIAEPAKLETTWLSKTKKELDFTRYMKKILERQNDILNNKKIVTP